MKTCPKCKSKNIDKGTWVALGGPSYVSDKKILKTLFSNMRPKVVVCLDCGYTETYLNTGRLKSKLK